MNRKTVISSIIILLLALLVFALSYTAIWLNDDVYFMFKSSFDEWLLPIKSLKDIIESQALFYMHGPARFVTHSIVHFYCALAGKTFFALSNAIVWPLLIVLIVKVAGISWREHPWAVFAAAVMAFICLRTQFTPPCQVNFIWAMAATLFVVECYLRPRDWSVWEMVLLAMFAYLAGFGQESISSGIAAAMWIHAMWHFGSMKWRQWVLLMAFTAGMLCLCLAPGNFSRFGFVFSIRYSFFAMLYFLRATYVMLAVAVILLVTRKTSMKWLYLDNAFWFNALFFMLLFNVIIKVYGNRQLFGVETMSIIITLRLLSRYPLGRALKTGLAAVLGVLVVLVAVEDFTTIAKRTQCVNELEARYKASPDGIIYYDIDDEEFLYKDVDAVYSLTHWTQLQMARQFKAQGYPHVFKCYPEVMKKLKGARLKSQVIRLGQNNGFVLIKSKGDTACTFRITRAMVYGPFTASKGTDEVAFEDLPTPYGAKIEDTYYDAIVWRYSDAYFRYLDAQLVE